MASGGAEATAPLLAANNGEPRHRRNTFAFACATLASMTTILMGYNLALMSGAQLFMKEDIGLTDEQIEVLAGSMNVFMLVSILAAGWTADALGRRGTLVLANVLLMAGALAMSLGATYAALMAARFVTSVGVGFSLVVAPVYNAEISPTSARGVLSSLLDQASGIDAIVLYSPLVFKRAGISSNTSVLAATVAVGVVKTCFILAATLLSDRLGRRPLLLASTGGIMPLRLRAQGSSLGMAVNRLTCGVVSMTFISLAGGITMPGCFFLYAGVAAMACVFVYFRLPETKGRSLEDMDVLFAKHPKKTNTSLSRTVATMTHDGDAAAAAAAPLLVSSGDKPCRRGTTFAFGCATLASMTTILMGYNLALMSGAQLFMKEDIGLTDGEIEVLTGSMNVFMLVSILAAGWAADVLGRRGTLVLANAFLMAGALAMSLGGSYGELMSARFVTSVGVGLARVVAPVYNAEISPPSIRGVLTSLLDMFVNVGILLSYVSNYALAGLPVHLGWRVMFGIGVVPPVLLAAGVLAMPESPRWLAMRGRHGDARAVLVRVSDTVAEADLRLEEITHAVAAPRDAAAGGGGAGVWRELIFRPTATVQRILAGVIGLQFFQQASGIDAIVLYSPLVFKRAGISSNTSVLATTIAIGVVKTSFILVATLLSDRLGRRPLLLASTGGMVVTLTTLALTLRVSSPSSSTASVASVMAFVAAFSVGLGPTTATYTAEVMPLRLRAQGASIGIAVNRLACGAVTMTFISLADGITMAGCFFLYAGVAAATFVFVYVWLPETKGRSLEDMDVIFDK
uniref:Major facilitator superfamily (MFS) profile domain-containing protein n=1 Tax=Leersia perrieri TaxID=77586 RepID=A0A0D9XUH0_9ORYZ